MSNAHKTTAEQADEHTLFMLRSTRYYSIRAECYRACSRCTPLCFRTERILHTTKHRDQKREIILGGKAIMTDALHWVAAIWAGFATKPVKSATAFSTTFVAVRALWSAVWDQAQFARRTGHRAYIHYCTRCTVRVRVFFLAAAAAGG